MGRPLNKRLFGTPSASTDTIKVQFYNGTASVAGYIVKQKGSKRFLCKDADGNTAICTLVNKASADLAAGEMTITVKYDNGTVDQVTKISAHIATVQNHQEPWTFSTSTTDGKVQMEEAGSDSQLTDNTDLEGDGFNVTSDYPAPGSGTYRLGSDALNGVTYASLGTPYEPGGSKTNSQTAGYGVGLRRDKYDGNFCAANNTAPSSWNYSWFGTTTFLGETFDSKVSWGQQIDGPVVPGGSNFSMEWKGWVQVPVTQDYNIYGEFDDHMAMWIGTAATQAPTNGSFLFAGNNKSLPVSVNDSATHSPNSITLDSTKWYPVRIWFSEFTGGTKAQVYFHGANGATYNGNDLAWKFNPQGEGW